MNFIVFLKKKSPFFSHYSIISEKNESFLQKIRPFFREKNYNLFIIKVHSLLIG